MSRASSDGFGYACARVWWIMHHPPGEATVKGEVGDLGPLGSTVRLAASAVMAKQVNIAGGTHINGTNTSNLKISAHWGSHDRVWGLPRMMAARMARDTATLMRRESAMNPILPMALDRTVDITTYSNSAPCRRGWKISCLGRWGRWNLWPHCGDCVPMIYVESSEIMVVGADLARVDRQHLHPQRCRNRLHQLQKLSPKQF